MNESYFHKALNVFHFQKDLFDLIHPQNIFYTVIVFMVYSNLIFLEAIYDRYRRPLKV